MARDNGNQQSYQEYYDPKGQYKLPGEPVASQPAGNWQDTSTYADPNRANTISGYYQKYLGRTPDQEGFDNWYNNGLNDKDLQTSFSGSPEAKAFAAAQQKNSNQSNPNDPRSALSALYAKYGLDVNNPGHGLAGIDYFMQRGQDTGGGWGNQSNFNYWAGSGQRTEQEIQKALYGNVGNLIDSGGGTGIPSYQDQYGGQNQKLIDLLMGRAQQSLNINPKTDPIIRPQVDQFGATQERSRRNYLNDLAESSSPYATGAQQTAGTQTSEASGQATAGLESQLTQNELNSRRSEIQNSLSELGSVLTADQQMALQEELGKIDAALKQQQINSGNDQFTARLGFDTTDRANYWDAIRSGLISG